MARQLPQHFSDSALSKVRQKKFTWCTCSCFRGESKPKEDALFFPAIAAGKDVKGTQPLGDGSPSFLAVVRCAGGKKTPCALDVYEVPLGMTRPGPVLGSSAQQQETDVEYLLAEDQRTRHDNNYQQIQGFLRKIDKLRAPRH